LNFQLHVKVVFDFISVLYMNTDVQAPEPLYYISRGAKCNDVKYVLSSSSKCEKRKSVET